MDPMDRIFLSLFSSAGLLAILGCATPATTIGKEPTAIRRLTLPEADKAIIGKKIWQNECAGTVAGLTSWNEGEDFPSLGIGHFIWYVPGRPGPFDESFPSMIRYLAGQGVKVPAWITAAKGSPWTSRSQFLAEQNSARMKELRQLLANNIGHQTGFIIQRLENSLPKMKALTKKAADQQRLEQNFYAVASSRAGVYSLIDYVNFKGEGTKDTETYNGQGWGLRQVLLEMRPNPVPANHEFSEAAKRTLQRRVKNSPPARGENRWLNGWMNRCEGYKKGI